MVAKLATKASQNLHAYTETVFISNIALKRDRQRTTSNRCNHIWLCNRSLDDNTQLQNGGGPSDIAQSY